MRIMRRLPIAAILLLLLLSACATKDTTAEVPLPKTPPSAAELAALKEGSAGAYFAVCQELLEFWMPETYLGIDLEGIDAEYRDGLVSLLLQDCEQRGLTLLLGNIDELVEKGYIERGPGGMPEGFEGGVVMSFRAGTLTDTELKIDAETWYGNLGMQGKSFTIEKKDGKWSEKENPGVIEGMWIA